VSLEEAGIQGRISPLSAWQNHEHYRSDRGDSPILKRIHSGQKYSFRDQVNDTTYYVWQHPKPGQRVPMIMANQ
jgi:hypothetical protein